MKVSVFSKWVSSKFAESRKISREAVDVVRGVIRLWKQWVGQESFKENLMIGTLGGLIATAIVSGISFLCD